MVNGMNGTNGRNGTGALTSAPILTTAVQSPLSNGNGITPKTFTFRRAVKRDAKLRMGLAGPGGSGKTYTALKIASLLGGRVAVVDTEHGSATKYADEFEFDVLELDHYDPSLFPDLIAQVAAEGYSTLVTDSLSHFWMGSGGELEQVDQLTARSKDKNSWAAWRHVSPKHTRMVDAILAAPIHVIVTMRVKTQWVVEKDERTGRSAPRKVGMDPVMRDGIEYEFDVMGDMDQDNTLTITKTRCPKLAGGFFVRPGAEVAKTLREWLNTGGATTSGSPLPEQPKAGVRYDPQPSVDVPALPALPGKTGEVKLAFAQAREAVGDARYQDELRLAGVTDALQLRPREKAEAFYHRLLMIAREVA